MFVAKRVIDEHERGRLISPCRPLSVLGGHLRRVRRSRLSRGDPPERVEGALIVLGAATAPQPAAKRRAKRRAENRGAEEVKGDHEPPARERSLA